ncbi:MAG: phosphoribosylformylglycinamidine cyclo-ligase [Nitrolancea sp.]
MSSRGGTYRSAGVDIDAGDAVKNRIAARVAATHGLSVLRGVGLFGGFYRAPVSDGSVVLVSSADSVGTKVLLANLVGNHRGIGADLVNHCVNDILACGARPLFFLDYYATPTLNQHDLEQIIDGMADACLAANCSLVGGETAQLPGIYRQDAYDLAGFIVGQVMENKIVDGSGVRDGDIVIGLPSDGLHTNGYTLARSALGLNSEKEIARQRLAEVPSWGAQALGDMLLSPHRSYLDDVTPLLDIDVVRGMAHITGGGIAGNLSRIIPDGMQASIDVESWSPGPLFAEIQRKGKVPDSEMYRVFNMGIGFILVVSQADEQRTLDQIDGAHRIGTVGMSASTERVRLVGLRNDSEAS